MHVAAPRRHRYASPLLAALVALAGLACLAPVHAREPAADRVVVSSKTIATQQSLPARCLAVALPGGHAVIDLRLVETVANGEVPAWLGPDERMVSITQGRAAHLLARGWDTASFRHCNLIAGRDLGDDVYLLAVMLRAGQAAVFPTGSSAPVADIRIEEVDRPRVMGWYEFAAGGEVLWTLFRWIR